MKSAGANNSLRRGTHFLWSFKRALTLRRVSGCQRRPAYSGSVCID